ncbi:MAG: bifunctional oligoribonuclease/PAP phosphatase NrnA [Opitutaceae bacterium]|nr:bifunctional oligoribonuclease/PAP phosphatase NrnA [Opitutaceae bacterium]MBP9913147.1 bifunctional oligoribonuclease/PAP phosphatase NrnA [Opitutaceae bacterium]
MSKFYPELSARFAQLLPRLAGRKLAVIGHARPDGDCIGSQVALTRALTAHGLDATCVNPDPVPRRLQFLTGGMTFLRTDAVLPQAGAWTAIFVDCADGARAGDRLKATFPAPLAMVDHHLSNHGFAEINLLDTGSAATCEILAGMLLDNGLVIDAQTAQALYTGILTDTGQFRFTSTSRRTFLLAAELLERGAKPSEAGYELYERETPGKMMLLQRFLASLRMECGGRLCIGTLSSNVFAETGSTAEDTEGLVDYARCIEGVDVGVLIEERADGTVKASLRAKEPVYRMDLIAGKFNGGGHACAAGLNLKQDVENFSARLIAAIAQQFAAVDAPARKKS